ncbi:restriction endonuclease subunit S [uncultured Alistipes sp.]|uniref:restriction endonuclease subunit S n=1 Tax=uncultured Alistipes sp. TaxID=538949 RepID=UPI0032080B5E
MGEWKTYRLGEICDVRDGTHDSPKQSLTGKPLVTSKNIKGGIINLSSTYLISNEDYQSINKRSCVHQWDILFSMIGTVGELAIVKNEPQFAIKNIGLFKMNGDQLLSYWIYYYLHSDNAQENILKNIKGSTQQYIALKDLRLLPIGLPPIEIRQRIVEILKSFDDKIELNRRINANLEAQAQALFRSWFVDFEPFRDGPFVDSELGKIPQGWKVAELGDVTKQQTEKVGPQKTVKVLSPITTGELVLSEEYFTKQVFSESIAKYIIVKPDQFAYNPARINIGSIGRNTFEFDGCVSPVYVVFECEKGYHYFFDFFRKTDAFKQEVISRAIGGVRQTLGYKDFALIKVIYPPQNVVLEFNRIYTNLLNLQNHNILEIKTLSALRDTLLPKLMAGEINVE